MTQDMRMNMTNPMTSEPTVLPQDEKLKLAREIAADTWGLDASNRQAVLNGEFDSIRQVRCALAAIEAAEKLVADHSTKRAIEIAVQWGGIDGGHHKAWVIDQMVRALAGDDYERLVAEARDGEDGPETYEWDEGIAP